MTAPVRVLLGPQNPERNIRQALDLAGVFDGPIAVVTAAWQEAENDLDELRDVAGRPLADLELYRRAEAVLETDADLRQAYRERQDRLQDQQRLYRVRLRSLAAAARRLYRESGDAELLKNERRHAIRQLKSLDRHHYKRTEALHGSFELRFGPDRHGELRRHHDEIRSILDRCSGVLITGGNVAILMNRLRLFGLATLLCERHLAGWSAGAMVLTRRIVLYHERMPQGRRDPEVFGAGLDLVPGTIILPDARHRLRTGERNRIGLVARRFAPDTCITLDNGTAALWHGDSLVHVDGARRLNRNGRLGRPRAA